MAKDAAITQVVRSGEVMADAQRNFTIAVEVQNLDLYLKLYYRFINLENEDVSVLGATITLPSGSVDAIIFAVESCANYQTGLFNVYNAIANSDDDIIIHLVDYIYEYG